MSSLPAPSRAWVGLSHALRAVFALLILAFSLLLVVDFWQLVTARQWIADPASISQTTAHSLDSWNAVATLIAVPLQLAVLVLFIVWLFQAHSSAAMNRPRMEHKSGWAIGGWFVPVLGLVRPYQVVQDVRLGSYDEFRAPGPLAFIWWLPLMLATALSRFSVGLVQDMPDDPHSALTAFRDSAALGLAADVCFLVAGGAGLVLVDVMTREVLQRHAAFSLTLAQPGPLPRQAW